jgi:hypothetical protein
LREKRALEHRTGNLIRELLHETEL